MKHLFFATALFVSMLFPQTTSVLKTASHVSKIESNSPSESDWNWELGDTLFDGIPHYWIYFQNRPNTYKEKAAIVPWYQYGAWAGLNDRSKEDGWKLLSKDFGTPNRRLDDLSNPYFVLYNSHRSIIRVFILIRNMSSTYDYSTMTLERYDNGGPSTGVLAHLNPVVYAVDQIHKNYNNASSSVINTLSMVSRWIYADFPLAYDPSLTGSLASNLPSGLLFKVYGTSVDHIELETKGFGAQGDKSFINAFIKRNNFDSPGFSLNTTNMPALIPDFDLTGMNIKATSPNWEAFKAFASNVKLDVGLDNLSPTNPFKGLVDGFGGTLSALSSLSPLGISGLDFGSLFKFFVGGGMKQANAPLVSPSYISSHYSSKGTMTSTVQYATLTIPVPGARSNYDAPTLGNPVGLISNDIPGVFTLTKTPTILKKMILRYANPTDPLAGFQYFNELEVTEPLEYKINPLSNLKLVSVDASLVDYYRQSNEKGTWLFNRINSTNQKYQQRFDGPAGNDEISYRSMSVPNQFFKGRKLFEANIEHPTVLVRVRAVLKRTDDAYAQPVVFIATYNVNIKDNGVVGVSYIPATMPTIPPQNVQCIVPAVGGVRVSWDRNQEGNISQYIVERSINSGSYVVIGKTKDTLVVDNEIEKSVKPYLSNRVNVSVNYRVRAKSEWFDDDSTKQVQFSDYSNVVSIAGSIINTLGKFGTEQVAPASSTFAQNFPNPFNPSTTIYYGVKSDGPVSIKVFNAVGQEVATLVNERKEVGYHYVEWNAAGMPSGMYFYRIKTADNTETRKMTLMK